MSMYMDDMQPPDGALVRCVSVIAQEGFTAGRRYLVKDGCVLDNGGRQRRFNSCRWAWDTPDYEHKDVALRTCDPCDDWSRNFKG